MKLLETPGLWELAALALLRERPMHPYEMQLLLRQRHKDELLALKRGSLYHAIERLLAAQLIEALGTERKGRRPERTTYRLTNEGETEFQGLLRDTLWKAEPLLDPLMPALCFMPVMRREELMAALKHRITQVQGMLEHSAFAVAELPNPSTPEHVKELYRLSAARAGAEIPWAQALLERLERGEYQILPHSGEPPAARPRRARANRGAKRG